MSEWTPGPWSVVVDDSGDRPLTVPSIQASEELDCAIVHWDGFWQPYWQSARGEKEWNANAHLIAAAPDLYEALERVLAAHKARAEWPANDSTKRFDAMLKEVEWAENAATTALAKARGEAQ